MSGLDGARAVVTGGASGIGAAIVRRLVAEGARVVVLDRDVEQSGLTDGVAAVSADVRDDEAVRVAIDHAVELLGGLDVVVNSAGIGALGGFEENDDDEWARVLDVNVVGLVRVTRAALPALRFSERAVVINIGSIAATAGITQRALYSASKGAVLALSRAMAADLVGAGIRVVVVNPGTVDTPWVGRILRSVADPAAERVALEARQPHGRLVRPEEVAAAVAYLASADAGSTTGTAIAVDGGMDGLRLHRSQDV